MTGSFIRFVVNLSDSFAIGRVNVLTHTVEVVKVFIASPSDLSEERRLFPRIINQINDFKARGLHHVLEAVGWEDALPGGGRPQEIINEDVKQCDVFVMLLWKRWGQPTGAFSSGTEEEFHIAYERYKQTRSPHLLLYFRSVPQAMMADPGDQLKQVLNFRAGIEENRICLYKAYDEPEQWHDLLVKHLCMWLDKRVSGDAPAIELKESLPQVPPEIQQRLIDLQQKLEERDVELESTRSRLRSVAISYAVEAMTFMQDGIPTRAEEMFATAVELYPDEPGVLNNFGRFLYQRGSLDRAKEMFERMLSVATNDEEDIYQANAYIGLGNVYKAKDALDKAAEAYENALRINVRLERAADTAEICVKLGGVYESISDLNKAEALFTRALFINKQLRLKEGQANSYDGLGNVYMGKNDLKKSAGKYVRAIALNRRLERTAELASTYSKLGIVLMRLGQLNTARNIWLRAIELDKTLGNDEQAARNQARIDAMTTGGRADKR